MAKDKYSHIKDRRERLIKEAIDLYGPRIFATHAAGILIGAAQMLLEHALYTDKDIKYRAQLAAADVDLIAHYLTAIFCPSLDEWDTALTLRLDNIERWIKSDRMKKEPK